MTTTTTTTTTSAVPSTMDSLMSSVFAVATVTVLGMLARNRLFTRTTIKSNGPPSSATCAICSCSSCGVSPSPLSAKQASLESLRSGHHSSTPEPTDLTFRTSRHSIDSPTSCEEISVAGHVSKKHREEEHQSSEAAHGKDGERDEDEGRVMTNEIDTRML